MVFNGAVFASYGYPVYYYPVAPRSVLVLVQQELRRDGYYLGPVDGIIGPTTRAAIAAYQRDHALVANGRVTMPLLEALERE